LNQPNRAVTISLEGRLVRVVFWITGLKTAGYKTAGYGSK
jgi:hypothetical protein